MGFLYTAVHEIGHALGLAHSDVKGSVMWPIAKKGRPKLHKDDIDGIRSLYGKNVSVITYIISEEFLKLLKLTRLKCKLMRVLCLYKRAAQRTQICSKQVAII